MKVRGVYLKCRDGDGREIWYFHVSYQRKQIHRRGGSYEAAVRRRQVAQDRIDRGLPPFPEENAKVVRVEDVVNAHVHSPRRAVRRAKDHAGHLTRLMPETVDRISEVALRKYRVDRRREGVCDSTINREILYLAAACRRAKCGGFFDALDKQARRGVYTKEDPGQPDRLSDEDVARIVANLPPSFRPPAWLALLTGMRENEILGLTWTEVRGGEVRLPGARTKSGYPRTVYLTEEARALLPKRREDHELVFVGRAGRSMSASIVKMWSLARVKAKLPRARFHDLRHEWASRYVEAGGTLIELMEAGGWRTLSQVQRYAKAEKARIRQTMAALSAGVEMATWQPAIAAVLQSRTA